MFFALHTLALILILVSSVNSFSVERLIYEEEKNKNNPSVDFEDASSSEPESGAFTINPLYPEDFQNLTEEKTADLKSHAFDKMLSEEILSIKKQLDFTTTTQFTLSFSTSTPHTPTVVVRQRWPVIEHMAKSTNNVDKRNKTKTVIQVKNETTNQEAFDGDLEENKIFDNRLDEKVIGLRSLNHRKDCDDETEEVVQLTGYEKTKSHNHKQCKHTSTRCSAATASKFCCTRKSLKPSNNEGNKKYEPSLSECNCGMHSQLTTPTHQCMHSSKCYTSSPQTQGSNEMRPDDNTNLCVCSNNCLQHNAQTILFCPPCPTIENIQYTNSPSAINRPTFYPPAGYQPGFSYSYYYLMQSSTFPPYVYPNLSPKPKHKRKHKTTKPKHNNLYYDDDSSEEYDSDYLEHDFDNKEIEKPSLDGKVDVEIKFDVEDVKDNEPRKNHENCGPHERHENEFVNEIAKDLKVYYSDAVIKDCYCSSSSKGIISQIILISFYCLCIHTVMPLLLFAV